MMALEQRRLVGWTSVVAAAVLAVALLGPVESATATAGPVSTGPLQPALFDAHLTRAPYLTDLVDQHVAVNFATDRSGTSATVQYGPVDSSGSCDPTTNVTPRRRGIMVGTVAEYQWTAEIDLPSTGRYCYRTYLGGIDLLGANASPAFTSQVPAGGTDSFSFDVMGDWGQVDATGQNPDMANLLKQVAASGARFMVTVGDNGYPNGNQVNYGDLQQTGKNTSAIFGPSFWTVPSPTMPIFTIPGNHGVAGPTHTDLTTWTQDRVVATSGGRYQDDVYCCVNGTTSSHYASEWYAFTAGNARFYLLDAAWGNANVGTGTMYSDDYAAHWAPGSPEREWLAKDLAAHPSQLKFAFFHYPLYVDNPTESSDTYLQGPDSLEGLLARNGVQMVFNGHAHLYERNTASAAGMPVSYVTGGGGGTLEPISGCTSIDAYGIGWSPGRSKGSACGAAATPTSAAQVYHFLKVTVSGGSVTVTPTNSLGQAFDVHRYDFGPPPPPDTWIDSGPAALTRETSATFTFHASGGSATFRCSLDGSAPTTCTSPVTYPGLGDGSHTFTVAATVAGIADPTPASSTWSVDTTPPPVPTSLTAAPSTTEIVLNWSPPSDGAGLAGYDVYRDGALAATAATPTWTDAQVPPGSHSYQVSALDDLGNESAKSDAVVAGLVVPPPVNPPPVSPPSGPQRIHLGGVAVRLPAGSRQVVTVNHAHRWHARVTLWQQAHGHWQRVARAHDGRIGQGGLVSARRHRQGRDDTPLGTYRLISAFGTHAAHRAWQLPYQQITSGDYWVRDNRSDFYNRYRNKADGGFRWWLPAQRVDASVPLAAHRREFEFVVVTSFNESQVRHRGAGIFLQVNAHRGTTGSVSAPRWFVRRTLGVLDPAMSPVIAIGR